MSEIRCPYCHRKLCNIFGGQVSTSTHINGRTIELMCARCKKKLMINMGGRST